MYVVIYSHFLAINYQDEEDIWTKTQNLKQM